MPAVTVIIPARDAAPTLGRALEALRAQQLDEPFEVIVVDDGSQDETSTIAVKQGSFIKLIRNEQSEGPGRARNRGVKEARANVLAFTDADCFATPDWLARGLEAIRGADLVQGRVEPDPQTPRTPFDRTLVVERDGGFYQTANLMVRREVFDAVGGFTDWVLDRHPDRRWSADRRRSRNARTPIGEDTLFAWRAVRLGARSTFASYAVVYHAVVPGDVRDDIADRWHWSRDMPGLARLVPELRKSTFYRRWFFNAWTAQFDLAALGLLAAGLTRRSWWLLATVPYAYRVGRESRRWNRRLAAVFALGSPAAEAATLAGFVAGSVAWRCVVL